MNTENVYENFREWLRVNFVYKKATKHPVTFNNIVIYYPRREDCSEQVLDAIIEEMNGGEAVFMQNSAKSTVHSAFYANIKSVK